MGKLELSCCLGGVNGTFILENSWKFLQKLNIQLVYGPAASFLCIYPREVKIMSTPKCGHKCAVCAVGGSHLLARGFLCTGFLPGWGLCPSPCPSHTQRCVAAVWYQLQPGDCPQPFSRTTVSQLATRSVEPCASIRGDRLLTRSSWMDLKGIMLSTVCQPQMVTCTV